MELLLSFFLLIISSVVGITIGLLLGMRSYLKLAIFVICIFIIVDLSYDYFNKDIKSRHSMYQIIVYKNLFLIQSQI